MMIHSGKTLFVHDVWDGKLADELRDLSLGLNVATADPGYSKKTLHDYLLNIQPLVLVIATPRFDWPIVTLYDHCLANKCPPMLFVVRGDIFDRDCEEWNMFWPHRDLVLHRDKLTGLSIISKIYELLDSTPPTS